MPETKRLKQYLHTLTIDRSNGEPLSETFEPHLEEPEISEREFALRFLRAAVGNIDQYVSKMLNDVREPPGTGCIGRKALEERRKDESFCFTVSL